MKFVWQISVQTCFSSSADGAILERYLKTNWSNYKTNSNGPKLIDLKIVGHINLKPIWKGWFFYLKNCHLFKQGPHSQGRFGHMGACSFARYGPILNFFCSIQCPAAEIISVCCWQNHRHQVDPVHWQVSFFWTDFNKHLYLLCSQGDNKHKAFTKNDDSPFSLASSLKKSSLKSKSHIRLFPSSPAWISPWRTRPDILLQALGSSVPTTGTETMPKK